MRVWTVLSRAKDSNAAEANASSSFGTETRSRLAHHALVRSACFVSSPDGVIREATKGLIKLLQAPSNRRILGTRIADFCETLGDRERLLESLRTSGSVSNMLIPIQTLAHTRCWVRITITPVRDALGHVEAQEGLLRDVTEWKAESDHAARAHTRIDALQCVLNALPSPVKPFSISRPDLEQALLALTGFACFFLLQKPALDAATENDSVHSSQDAHRLSSADRAQLRPWIEHCIRTGRTVRVPADSAAGGLYPPGDEQSSGPGYTVILPVRGSSRLVGTLVMQGPSQGASLSDETVELVVSILRGLGLCLDGCRLRQDAERERQRLNHLFRAMTDIRERERAHIARELHDGIGQALTALEFGLQRAKQDLSSSRLLKARTALQGCEAISSELHETIRELSHGLRPSVLDDVGLKAALESHFISSAGRLGIQGELETAGLDDARLSTELETTLYRMSQEALTNTARHGEASQVTLRIARTAHRVIWSFRDNGKGFDQSDTPDPPSPGQGMGLLEMEKRVMLLGGKLRIRSSKGQGTALLATLPLSAPPQDDPPSTRRNATPGGMS